MHVSNDTYSFMCLYNVCSSAHMARFNISLVLGLDPTLAVVVSRLVSPDHNASSSADPHYHT